MKMRRIVSLLLSAVLMLTFIPFIAPAVSADVTRDYLEGKTPSSTYTDVNVTDGNSYLHISGFDKNANGLAYILPEGKAFEAGHTYKVSLSGRASVKVYDDSRYQAAIWPGTGNGVLVTEPSVGPTKTDGNRFAKFDYPGSGTNATGWNNYEWTIEIPAGTSVSASKAHAVFIQQASQVRAYNIDIDNFKITDITNTSAPVPVCDTVDFSGKTEDYMATSAKDYGKFYLRSYLGTYVAPGASGAIPGVATVETETDYRKAEMTSGTYFSYGSVDLPNGDKTGALTLKANLRLDFSNRTDKTDKGSDKTAAVVITAKLNGASEDTKLGFMPIANDWTEVSVALPEGTKAVADLKFALVDGTEDSNTANSKGLHIKNVELLEKISVDKPLEDEITITPIEGDILSSVKPTATGRITTVTVAKNKYLHITERDLAELIATDNIKDSNIRFGIGYEFDTSDIPDDGVLTVKFKARADIEAGETVSLYVHSDNFSGSWKQVSGITDQWGEFTATDTSKAKKGGRIAFNTNKGNYFPFDIDDIEVYYELNGKRVDVLTKETFNSYEVGSQPDGSFFAYWTQTKYSKLISDYPITVQYENEYRAVAPTENTDTTVKYVLDTDLAPGIYRLNGALRVPIFNADDFDADDTEFSLTIRGSDASNTILHKSADISNEWVYVSYAFRIDENTYASELELILDGALPLDICELSLTYEPDEVFEGRPNFGIVMMILKKKSGESGSSKPKFETVEFVENGNFDVEPTIYKNTVPKTNQNGEPEGWYERQTAAVSANIEYVTEDGNSFLRVSNVDNAQKGVFWNTGITLTPGTYTFKMDVRVSETEDAPAYNAYKWRDTKKETIQIRANLHNPASMFNPNYEAFVAVDISTEMNDSGAVVGTRQIINRKWSTYTDTIVVDKDTLAVFKIGGGTGGELDCHGFDIDNISLAAVVQINAPEAETEKDENELIVNGDFSISPTIFYNTVPKAVQSGQPAGWYERQSVSATVKLEYVVEKDNGFLRVSDIPNSQKGVFWNTGVVLEPGKYTLKMDLRVSENEDAEAYNGYAWRDNAKQTIQIRANLHDPNSFFNPNYAPFSPVDINTEMNDAGQVIGHRQIINRKWSTYTDIIVVDKPTLAVFKIGGGTGGELDCHGFDIDNISLTRVE